MDKIKKDYEAANLLHQVLCAKTNCFEIGNQLKKTDFIVSIDDDPTSAIYAVRLAKMHYREYGVYPSILCVGNKGLLSRWTHKTTEGKFLQNVCIRLGFPKELTVVLDNGRNTGENILEILQFLKSTGNMDKIVLFCCTKRLSLRIQLTQLAQAKSIHALYYVIEESLNEACKWYNGKRFGNCTMMYHELASILNRCEAYAGTFQAPIPFPISQDVRNAAGWLESRYRLKLPHKNLRSLRQFVWLLSDVLLHKKRMAHELEQTLAAEL